VKELVDEELVDDPPPNKFDRGVIKLEPKATPSKTEFREPWDELPVLPSIMTVEVDLLLRSK